MEVLYANITNLSIQVILSTGLVIFRITFLIFEDKILSRYASLQHFKDVRSI